jgi:hypothetical protein
MPQDGSMPTKATAAVDLISFRPFECTGLFEAAFSSFEQDRCLHVGSQWHRAKPIYRQATCCGCSKQDWFANNHTIAQRLNCPAHLVEAKHLLLVCIGDRDHVRDQLRMSWWRFSWSSTW